MREQEKEFHRLKRRKYNLTICLCSVHRKLFLSAENYLFLEYQSYNKL